MCDFWLSGLKAAGDWAKRICCFLCCLCVTGPILMIIGIIMLVSPNDRAKNVDQYNSAIQNYDKNAANQFIPATIGGKEGKVITRDVVVNGNKEKVNKATSTLIHSAVPSGKDFIMFTLRGVKEFSRIPSRSQTKVTTLYCSTEKGCSATEMKSRCSGVYEGGGCDKSGSCGSCKEKTYLVSYCAVVSKSSSQYIEDSKKSCFYPFNNDDQKYENYNKTNIFYEVRTSDDPFIILQELTKGSNNFGITAKQQRLLGVGLIVVGALFISCVLLLLFAVYKLIMIAFNRNSKQDQTQQPMLQVPPIPPYLPQKEYPSQQPNLPQQQECPGQPTYGYGQPTYGEPTYGQPTYGQPTYGQPTY